MTRRRNAPDLQTRNYRSGAPFFRLVTAALLALGMSWDDMASADNYRPYLRLASLDDEFDLSQFAVRSEITGINYLNDLVSVSVVSEPNSLPLALLGFAGLAASMRRPRGTRNR